MALAGKQGGFVPEHFLEDSLEQHEHVERYVAHIVEYLKSVGYEPESLDKGRVLFKGLEHKIYVATHIYDDLRFEVYIRKVVTVALEDLDNATKIAHRVTKRVGCTKVIVEDNGEVWVYYEAFYPNVETFIAIIKHAINQVHHGASDFIYEYQKRH